MHMSCPNYEANDYMHDFDLLLNHLALIWASRYLIGVSALIISMLFDSGCRETKYPNNTSTFF